MAPEIVELADKYVFNKRGYTYMVDYWALGVMTYLLFAGKMPFKLGSTATSHGDDCKILRAPFTFPLDMSSALRNLIQSLLMPNESDRLGYGLSGFNNIKNHEFFNNLDWDLLAQKRVRPPIIPGILGRTVFDVFGLIPSEKEKIVDIVKELLPEMYSEEPWPKEKQHYFDHW